MPTLGFFLGAAAFEAIVGVPGLSEQARAALSGAVRGNTGPRRRHVTSSASVLRELRAALAAAGQEATAERRPARARACLDAVTMIDVALEGAAGAPPGEKLPAAAESQRKGPGVMRRRPR